MHISEPFQKSISKFVFRKEGASLFTDIKIESERLTLSPVTQDYAEIIFQEFTPEIRKYMVVKVAKSIADTRSFIDEMLQGQKDGRDVLFVILSKASREFLGTVGFHAVDNGRKPALGIWVKKDQHGNGTGVEAIEAVCKWAEKSLKIDHFIYEVAKDNVSSRKIPEKLCGDIVRKGKIRTYDGDLMDEITYHIPVPIRRR